MSNDVVLHRILPTPEGDKTLSLAMEEQKSKEKYAHTGTIEPAMVNYIAKAFKNAPEAVFVKTEGDKPQYVLTLDSKGKKETWHLVEASAATKYRQTSIRFSNGDAVESSCSLKEKSRTPMRMNSNTRNDAHVNIGRLKADILASIDEAGAYETKRRQLVADELGKTFTSSLQAELSKTPDARLIKVNENGYGHAFIAVKNGMTDKWYLHNCLEETGDKDSYEHTNLYLRNAKNPEEEICISFSLFEKTAAANLASAIANHISDHPPVKPDPARVAQFDLPKDRPIGYLGFSGMGDASNAFYFADQLKIAHALPEIMSRCGYDTVCIDDKKRISTLTVNPEKAIESQVTELYNRGVRDFYLNFKAHGSQDETLFSWDDPSGHKQKSKLTPSSMEHILSKFKDCRFTINTSACYGGGMIKLMRNFKDQAGTPEARVTLFTHTKEDKENYDSYGANLLIQLNDMARNVKGAPKNYGEAHQRLDGIAPPINDPEFWKSMPAAPSQRTAQNDALPTASKVTSALAKAADQYRSGYNPILVFSNDPNPGSITFEKIGSSLQIK